MVRQLVECASPLALFRWKHLASSTMARRLRKLTQHLESGRGLPHSMTLRDSRGTPDSLADLALVVCHPLFQVFAPSRLRVPPD